MEIKDIQLKIKPTELLKKGWVQRVWARDAFGQEIPPIDRSAVCYCAVGAIKAALIKSRSYSDTVFELYK